MKNKKFWNFVRDSDNNEVELIIDGEIAPEESWWKDVVSSKNFTQELRELGDVDLITVRINSGGGDVFAAHTIYSRLRDHKARIIVKIDGWAASAATIIAMAGDEILIPTSGVFMIHNPVLCLCGAYGEQDLESLKSELQVVKDSIINSYITRTGKSKEEIGQLMSNETWYTGEEAVENGFCDKIMFEDVSAEQEVENSGHYVVNHVSMNFDNYNIPDKVKKLCKTSKNNKEVNMSKLANTTSINGTEVMASAVSSSPISVKDLKDSFPALCAEIENAARAEERKRIQAIDEATLPGYESIAKDAKYTKLSSVENFALDILKAEKYRGKQYVIDTAADAKDSHVNDVGVVNAVENMTKGRNDLSVLDSVLPKRKDGGLFRA